MVDPGEAEHTAPRAGDVLPVPKADGTTHAPLARVPNAVLEVFWVALRLGLTSFGGPIAHLGYFREEYVVRRKWVDEHAYADLIALSQSLPGPASSKLGIAIGITRAGLPGALAAWLGFTLPSAIALALFAFGIAAVGDLSGAGWLHGLKIVAVAVVALAVWGMARTLTPDRPRITLAVLAAVTLLALPTAITQFGVIVAGGLLGWWLLRGIPPVPASSWTPRVSRGVGIACWVAFFALLLGLPLVRQVVTSDSLAIFDSFFRAGSLVFGGGHVVLPLLQAEVVPPGWVTNEEFLAGYGAAQAVPGPLFTFSAYLGAVMDVGPGGWGGAALALVAIFIPAFLLIIGPLPFWGTLRRLIGFRRALSGVNAAVVGLLLAALYDPVWTSAIHAPADLALGLMAFGLLAFWKWPPWLVVLLAAGGGAGIAFI